MHFFGFKLTTDVPLERFKNLPPRRREHTRIIVDGGDFSYWCEKHLHHYEFDEFCFECEAEEKLKAENVDDQKSV